MSQHVLMQDLEAFRRHWPVVVPPDDILGRVIAHDELVLRRATRVLAGDGSQRAVRRQVAFPVADRFFVKFRFREVVIDAGNVLEADRRYPIGRIVKSELLHARLPSLGVGCGPQLAPGFIKSK